MPLPWLGIPLDQVAQGCELAVVFKSPGIVWCLSVTYTHVKQELKQAASFQKGLHESFVM